MQLSPPETLEIASIAGDRDGRLYLRAFRRVDDRTLTDTTLILKQSAENFELMRVILEECTDLLISSSQHLIVLGRFGNLYLHDGKTWYDFPSELRPAHYLNLLRWLHDAPYAAGTGSRLLRWTGERWETLPVAEDDIDLLDLATMPSGDFLLAGSEGFLARYAGRDAERFELPTNCDINAIEVGPDGTIVAAGSNGTLLSGRSQLLADLSAPERETDFVAVQLWQNRYFISAESHVLVLEEKRLDEHADLESYDLAVTAGRLWNISTVGLHYLDNNQWTPFEVAVEVPEDRPKRPRRRA